VASTILNLFKKGIQEIADWKNTSLFKYADSLVLRHPILFLGSNPSVDTQFNLTHSTYFYQQLISFLNDTEEVWQREYKLKFKTLRKMPDFYKLVAIPWYQEVSKFESFDNDNQDAQNNNNYGKLLDQYFLPPIREIFQLAKQVDSRYEINMVNTVENK